jgi:glutamate carboxypeptidase
MRSVMRSLWARPVVRRFSAAVAIVLGSVAADAAENRAATERQLVEFLAGREQHSIELLAQIVNINSGSMNFAGVRKVADVLRPHFEALGFSVRWVDGAAFGRAGHLVAERKGRGPHVLLIGHLDTVFEPNHPLQRFQRVDAHIVRGPGTSDMKGGIVVGLAALEALQSAKVLDGLRVTVVLTGDEESSGTPLALARQVLVDAAKTADVAIGLENGGDDPATAVVARRGYTGWRVAVKAKSAHSSNIFSDDVGAGAIYEIARILHGFYNELRGDEYVTFNPGLVAGSAQLEFQAEPLSAETSGKDNIIAPIAVATGDLRTLTLEQREQTKERMRKIVAAHLPHASATIEFNDGYPPMAPSPGHRRLLSLYDQVSRDLGFGPVVAVNPRKAGAADIAFASDHVDMAIDALGLLGGRGHTPDEFADLRTFQIQAQRLAVLLSRLR